jgi:hypothetical protein
MGFRRVQINATAINGVDTSKLSAAVPKLTSLMAKYDNLEYIIQKNEETKPLWNGIFRLKCGVPSNVSMLMDESKGTGVLSKFWSTPPEVCSIGYAGGIGPDNIKRVLNDISLVAGGKEVWIDMETSLRTVDANGKDSFDLNKCIRCIDSVCKIGIHSHPSYLCE